MNAATVVTERKKEWKKKKENEILAKITDMTQKTLHSSQALVSSIILLLGSSRSLCGPFPRNEHQPALSQGFQGWVSSLVWPIRWKCSCVFIQQYTYTLAIYVKASPITYRKYNKHPMPKSISAGNSELVVRLRKCSNSTVQSWNGVSVDSIPISILKKRRFLYR